MADSNLQIEPVGKVAVARFVREVVLSGARAELAATTLTAHLGEPDGCRLLIDFANVQSLSSLMLAKLVLLNRAAEAAGGRLALCKLRPEVREILEVTGLTQVLCVYHEEPEALQSF